MTIRALVTSKTESGLVSELMNLDEASLGEGDVLVAVEWSTVNYKDGLALSGAPIMRTFPMIGGIDFAGTVEASSNPLYRAGDKVLVNGWGLSQTHNGGYAQKARVPADWLIPIPSPFTTQQAMAIGTAGYTAMLCVMALEHGGMTPARGDVLVTGANGGVGSISISLLSALGYRVVASTGRMEESYYLRRLGAEEVIDRAELSGTGKAMGSERWSCAVDSVGSNTLANVLAQTKYRGVVAACGRAQGADLPGSMAPFILRNITLAGIDSVNTPREVRLEAWRRLAQDLDPDKLASTVSTIGLAAVPRVAADILQGKVRGRTLVDVND